MITFRAHGLPAAQGSKNPWGGESSKRLKPWRNDVAVAASKVMDGDAPFTGPVQLRATFIFSRPKSHFGTGRNAGTVKENAPGWMTKMPDLDKLVRAVGDAITGIVFRDDSQVVELAVVKVYGPNPGVIVAVEELEL